MKSFVWSDTIAPFLVAIFLINSLLFVCDLSIWQKISASDSRKVVSRGLLSGAIKLIVVWVLIVIFACSLPGFLDIKGDPNPLFSLLEFISRQPDWTSGPLLFICSVGLCCALLSTASTLVVAMTQTIYVDILSKPINDSSLAGTASLKQAKTILIISAILGICCVKSFEMIGFSVADLILAIYGSQLALVPLTCLALFFNKPLKLLRSFAINAIVLGFCLAWTCAFYGKYIHSDDLVFLAPLVGFIISSLVMMLGVILNYLKKN